LTSGQGYFLLAKKLIINIANLILISLLNKSLLRYMSVGV